jgi:hypothetical protein
MPIRLPVHMLVASILAEMKLLRAVFPQWIACEPLSAIGTQVVSEVLIGRFREVGIGKPLFHILQQLGDRFHVVFVEVRFGDLGGVMCSENFDLDHVAVVVSRSKLLAAEITRDV